MFDLQTSDSGAADNSVMNIVKKTNRIDSLKSNPVNCPIVLTGMSHEMRTHMNAIVAFSFLMKDNCTNTSESDEFSKMILKSCEQMIGIFDSFLDSALIDVSSSGNNARSCKIENLLDDLVPEFRDMLKKQGAVVPELLFDLECGNPDVILLDKNKIFKVLRCLFQNSLKTTTEGFIKIGYCLENENVTFHVHDTGNGYFRCKEFLHTEDLNESLIIHNDVQTAINITLAKKLIKILGGSIRIECVGALGTGIYFSVPVKTIITPKVNDNKNINTMIAI
jgi:K+-sensing histidine kinase KdpD